MLHYKFWNVKNIIFFHILCRELLTTIFQCNEVRQNGMNLLSILSSKKYEKNKGTEYVFKFIEKFSYLYSRNFIHTFTHKS